MRIDGGIEVGPIVGAVARGRRGEDATYQIRNEPQGGSCAEVITVNNSCFGAILAGEVSEIVACRIPTVMYLRDR